jgi:hypothetical protein
MAKVARLIRFVGVDVGCLVLLACSSQPKSTTTGPAQMPPPSTPPSADVPVNNPPVTGTSAKPPPPAPGSIRAPSQPMAPSMGSAGATAQMGEAAGNSGATVGEPSEGTDPDACSRACLIDILSGYLDALAKQDKSAIKTAESVKYTENGTSAMLGSGLWQTATGVRQETRLDFGDPVEGQVGSQLVMEENGSSPVLLQVRLKVVKHEITEIETIVMRAGAGIGFDADGMVPFEIFKQPIDPAKIMPRAEMKTTTDPYLDALESGDFTKIDFDEGVKRKENGTQTSDYAAFKMRTGGATGREVVRRYLAFDEEYGLVFGIFPFTTAANSQVASEVFKVMDKKIMMINVVLTSMPAKAWD